MIIRNIHAIILQRQTSLVQVLQWTYLEIVLDIFILAEKHFPSSSNISSDFLNNLLWIKHDSLFT